MNETTLFLILGGAALFLLTSKKGGTKPHSAPIQTSPSARNPNLGIGNGPNSINSQISNAATAATNGITAVGGLIKSVTGSGNTNTAGQTVPSLPGTTTASGGNDSFDAQDAIANMSGADSSHYADSFMDDEESLNNDLQANGPS